MSHFSRIKTQMIEKEYLLKALEDLGYSYEEGNVTVSGFQGEQTPVDIRIPMNIGYDIGFRKVRDRYEVIADWWGVTGLKPKRIYQRTHAALCISCHIGEAGITRFHPCQRRNW
jgi:hypothetical protein